MTTRCQPIIILMSMLNHIYKNKMKHDLLLIEEIGQGCLKNLITKMMLLKLTLKGINYPKMLPFY